MVQFHADRRRHRLLPVITMLAIAMGMGAAPKQELLINLTCLAHPPRSQSALAAKPMDISAYSVAKAIWNMPSSQTQAPKQASSQRRSITSTNGTDPTMRPAVQPLTPADKWLLDLQRRIAADERRKRLAAQPAVPTVITGPDGLPVQTVLPSNESSDAVTTTVIVSRTVASSRLPQPTGPIGDRPFPAPLPSGPGQHPQTDPTHEDDHWENDDEIRPGEIDPRLCKKDPKTQAAAAKLTMSEHWLDSSKEYRLTRSIYSHDVVHGHVVCHDDRLLGQLERPIRQDQDHGSCHDRPDHQVGLETSHHTLAFHLTRLAPAATSISSWWQHTLTKSPLATAGSSSVQSSTAYSVAFRPCRPPTMLISATRRRTEVEPRCSADSKA